MASNSTTITDAMRTCLERLANDRTPAKCHDGRLHRWWNKQYVERDRSFVVGCAHCHRTVTITDTAVHNEMRDAKSRCTHPMIKRIRVGDWMICRDCDHKLLQLPPPAPTWPSSTPIDPPPHQNQFTTALHPPPTHLDVTTMTAIKPPKQSPQPKRIDPATCTHGEIKNTGTIVSCKFCDAVLFDARHDQWQTKIQRRSDPPKPVTESTRGRLIALDGLDDD